EAGGKMLVAYLVAQQGELPAPAALRAFVKQWLPEHMVPAAFIFLSELPLTPNGKIDRRALPAPEHSRVDQQAPTTTPTPIEEIITGICAQLLKYEAVSGADNFFELGGHS